VVRLGLSLMNKSRFISMAHRWIWRFVDVAMVSGL